MKKIYLASLTLLLSLTGCKSGPDGGDMTGGDPQSVVQAMISKHSDCTRLTLHCMQQDGTAKVCASTATERLGTVSDPEDLQAMRTGEAVVLEEGMALDVTVPIFMNDGKWCTVCGVTLAKSGASRAATIEKAKGIAMAVKTALGDCCGDCCK